MTKNENPTELIRSLNASSEATTKLVLIENGSAVIPDASALLTGNFDKLGDDLLVVSPSGERSLVKDFFASDLPPTLTDGQGLIVSGRVVGRIAEGPKAREMAQEGSAAGTDPIGIVQATEGEVTVERADGSIVVLSEGDAVYMGDLIITGEAASIGLVFLDETTFALGEDGELVLDELIYDPCQMRARQPLPCSLARLR